MYDNEGYYFIKNLYSLTSDKYNLKYLLAILNSNLMNFFFKKYLTTKKEDIFPEIQAYQINQLPIPNIDLDNKEQKEIHDKLVNLVDSMILLNKKLREASNPHEKEVLTRQIVAVDSSIDKIVYELYNLSDDEIKIIEGVR